MASSSLRPIKEQIVSLTVTAANQSVSTSNVSLDTNYKKVKAIQASCTDSKAFDGATFQKFEINSRTIFQQGHECKLIAGGQDCPVNGRWYDELDEMAANVPVEITYTDNNVAGTVFPYTVNIYFRLVNEQEK